MDFERIFKAINFASVAHYGQKRKTVDIPKISHAFGVGALLMKYGYDDDIVIAGLLHDIIEDCEGYTTDRIKKEFGARVANLVSDETEISKKEDWITRKTIQIEFMKTANKEAKIICAADKLHNLTSLLEDMKIQGEDIYKSFNAPKENIIWYYNEMFKAIKFGINEKDIPILEKLDEKINLLNEGVSCEK